MVANSFIYLLISKFDVLRRFKPMDNYDKAFAFVCFIVSAYASLRIVFDAIYMPDIYIWIIWGVLFIMLLIARVKTP